MYNGSNATEVLCKPQTVSLKGGCHKMAGDWVWDTFLVEAVLPACALYCLLGLHTLMKQAAVLERTLWAETGGSWSSACIRLAKKAREFMG